MRPQFPIRMPGGMAPKEEPPATIDNLDPMIDYANLECLNIDSSTPVTNALKQNSDSLVIQSDTDPQILFNIAFLNTVKVHHLKIKAKDDGTGPKKVKIFGNRINMGFSDAEEQKADQEFVLTPENYSGDIELKYVKFQRVDRITIFIEDNYGAPKTVIQKLELWGCAGKGTDVLFKLNE
uniref:PITH domain-containing protein n=1 Tax=Nyctotherus ovalis TaxID=70075 RepID=A6MI44_NYCOV|nr:unknown [Nyctotherus ovalis]